MQQAVLVQRQEVSVKPAVVELSGVTLKIAGRSILHDVALSVHPGEFVGLIGPNGAGKTTLLRLILGLLRPSSGSVKVFGEPVSRGNSRIGYVPQHQSLHADMPLRGRDFVRLGITGDRFGLVPMGDSVEMRVAKALQEVEAAAYADAPVGRLSGGEQQRLMLAQALVAKPDLLLLDEPLANLDLRSRRDVVNLVGTVCRNRNIAVLFVAHDVNPLVSVMDRVLYLANGHAVTGRPDEVIRTEVLTDLFGFPVRVIEVEGHIVVTAVGEADDCHA